MQIAKSPIWNLDHPEEKLFIENGEIEITKPTTYQDKELSCAFTIDASTDFIPPSKLFNDNDSYSGKNKVTYLK